MGSWAKSWKTSYKQRGVGETGYVFANDRKSKQEPPEGVSFMWFLVILRQEKLSTQCRGSDSLRKHWTAFKRQSNILLLIWQWKLQGGFGGPCVTASCAERCWQHLCPLSYWARKVPSCWERENPCLFQLMLHILLWWHSFLSSSERVTLVLWVRWKEKKSGCWGVPCAQATIQRVVLPQVFA